ncbi:MAG TPA: ABC transporter ATP-binding protein [Candidatus Saccharimonadales bacterium]|nr:ABC transporter ATP-binding protein [Candidatus Saccharimonadales bacterium]
MQPVIEIFGLSKLFGIGDATTTALDSITLTIDKGEFVAIMGPSGSGKTTLMNIIGLLDTPTHGEYYLEGKSVAELGQRRRAKMRRDHIGMVFQNFNLLSRINVIENVALPLTYKGILPTARLNAASKILKSFGLNEREYYMPYQLSGGQLQRVAIARALVTKPSLILADEPTGNLDTKSSEIIMEELADIHRRGNTIIMVTHNPDVAIYADRIIQMVDGRIASDSKHPIDEVEKDKRPLSTFRKAMEAAVKANEDFANATEAMTEEALPQKPTRKSKKTRRKAVKKGRRK